MKKIDSEKREYVEWKRDELLECIKKRDAEISKKVGYIKRFMEEVEIPDEEIIGYGDSPISGWGVKSSKIVTEEDCNLSILRIWLLNNRIYLEKYNIIPQLKGERWWLRCYEATTNVVDEFGRISSGAACSDSSIGVRPALHIEVKRGDFSVGDKIKIAGITWTVLEVNRDVALALCDEIVARRPYGEFATAWHASEMKLWLEDWIEYLVMGLENVEYVNSTE